MAMLIIPVYHEPNVERPAGRSDGDHRVRHQEGLQQEGLQQEGPQLGDLPQVSRERTRLRTAHTNLKCADALFYSYKL